MQWSIEREIERRWLVRVFGFLMFNINSCVFVRAIKKRSDFRGVESGNLPDRAEILKVAETTSG
jgi:hypothetical protein